MGNTTQKFQCVCVGNLWKMLLDVFSLEFYGLLSMDETQYGIFINHTPAPYWICVTLTR